MTENRILEKKIGGQVKKNPFVSIVTPAYNVAEFIAETLDSALTQTFQDFEIIVVNDGSPDTESLEKVLAPYFDKIIYIKQKNGGASVARNTAIENASGEFLAFLDGDDIWYSQYLASQTAAAAKKNCDLIYCDALLFGDYNTMRETYSERCPSKGLVTTESLLAGTCNVITSGTLARREKVLSVGMFDEKLPRIGMEDFDLWFRLAKSGAKLDYQTEVLLKYRTRADSLSGSALQRAERSIKAIEIIRDKYELTANEKSSCEEVLKELRAAYILEKGKIALVNKDYSEARQLIAKANEYFQKPKLSFLIMLLTVNPRIVLHLFKKIRPAETSFLAARQK